MQSVTLHQLVYDAHEGIYLFRERPYNGLLVSFHENGIKKHENELKGGIAWGTGRSWFSNGNMKSESEFAGGVQHGISREWYENGQIALDAVFELGIKTAATKFDELGNVLEEYIISEDSNNFKTLTILRKHFGELTLPDAASPDESLG